MDHQEEALILIARSEDHTPELAALDIAEAQVHATLHLADMLRDVLGALS